MFRNVTLYVLSIIVLQGMFGMTHASESLEYQLARINAGGYISRDHITVARFRSLLNHLSSTYIEKEQQIADMSVKAQQLLRKDGVAESLLNIMEGMNQIFTRKLENQKYAEYLAAYITLRSKGQSHTEAVRGLQGLLRGLGVQ